MFHQRPFLTSVVVAAAVLLLAAAPTPAQHYRYGGYRHGGYGGTYHGYYPGHYSGYVHHGYYPGHYGYYHHYGYYPSYQHYGWGYPGYYSSQWGGYPGYAPGYYGYSVPQAGYWALYPPNPVGQGLTTPTAPAGADQVVHFNIRVPADAEVWFDDVKTSQTGSAREFISPPLAPGREYSYEIQARWKEQGREVSQRRRVTVKAGQRMSIAFPQTAPAKGK